MDQQILKELDELKREQTAQVNSRSKGMNLVSFQLVQEGDIEKPAVGFSAKLTKAGGKTDTFTLSAVADQFGKLDFGKLPWGTYSLSLHSQLNETSSTSHFTTIPGRAYSGTIICPVAPQKEVPVQFQVVQTENAAVEWNYLLCDFRHRDPDAAAVKFALDSSRKVHDLDWLFSDDLQKFPELGVYLIDMKNNQVISCPLTAEGKFEDIELQALNWQPSIKTRQGQYQAPVIYLIRKNELPKLSELNSLKPFSVIDHSPKGLRLPVVDISPKGLRIPGTIHAKSGMILDPFEKLNVGRYRHLLEMKYGTAAKLIHGVQSDKSTLYIAAKERPNVWEIKIPDLNPITRESGSLSSVP